MSSAPSNMGSRAKGSGDADPWLELSGGVYTFREGKDADVEVGDCGTYCGGVG